MNRREFFSELSAEGFVLAAGAGVGFCSVSKPEGGECVKTISDLRQMDPFANKRVFVQGYHEPFDGGGGLFFWKDEERHEPDGGLIVESSLDKFQSGHENTGCWRRFVNEPVWNVRWWGARGTAEVDDAPAIQAAIDAAKTQAESTMGLGGDIFIPPGKYRLDGPVLVPSGVSITGAGMSATRLVAGLNEGAMLRVEQNTGFQCIRKLSFRSGSPRPDLTAIKLAGHGTANEGAGNRNIHISDVYIWSVGRGVHGKRCWMTRLSNVRIKKAETGILFEEGYTTLLFENCFVDNCTIGIRIQGIDTATFNSCGVDKARRHAVWLESGSYVFNTFQSEANWYTENISSIFRIDGPCTVQLNGSVTHAIGVEDATENVDAESDQLYFLDCRANNGPVHVNATAGRREKTMKNPGSIKQIRFVSESTEHTNQSSVHVTQGFFDGIDQIDIDTPEGSSPQVLAPQLTQSARIRGNEGKAAGYQIRGRLTDAGRSLNVDDVSSEEVAQVLATLINDLQQNGIIN
jgi:hypothetical protein